MRISESCAACLYDKQKNKTNDEEYLAEIRYLLDNRKETDTSPYMVYLFNKVHVRRFGAGADYRDIKKRYNDLVLGMEDSLREEIEKSEDPLAKALIMARVGNYIDFGAMNHVDQDEFLTLFRDTEIKGQGNYETMSDQGRHIFYAFLCKCDLFTGRFNVPRLTGIFTEEK